MKNFLELENEVAEYEDRNAVESFIWKLEKLQEIGVDVSKIAERDNIQTLAEKSGIGEKELQEIGLDPSNNIGRQKSTISQAYRGKRTCTKLTEEQVEILLKMGISLEERNTIQDFIEKLQKLENIGVEVSKINTVDTIKTLAEKSGIGEKELQEIGLDPSNDIGPQKDNISRAYRGKGRVKKPTEEQVEMLLKMGISLEERNTIQDFIEKLQKLEDIGVDVSKMVQKDTIKTLAEKSGIGEKELQEIGLDPSNNIGSQKNTISQAYRGKEGLKKPTEEQVEILLKMGISLDGKKRTKKEIAEASISSLKDIEMSDEEDSALRELVEKTKEGGIKRDE